MQEEDPDLPFAQLASEQYSQLPAQKDSKNAATHSNTLPNNHMESTSIDAHLTQPYLSVMECIALNNIRANATIWIPAILQPCILPQPTKPCPHHPDPTNSPFLTTVLTSANNLLN